MALVKRVPLSRDTVGPDTQIQPVVVGTSGVLHQRGNHVVAGKRFHVSRQCYTPLLHVFKLYFPVLVISDK